MDYHKNTSGGRVVASSNLVIPTTDRISHCNTVAYSVFKKIAGTKSGRSLLTYLFLLKGKDK